MTVLEKTIEAALVQRVKSLGGMAEKFTSPAKRSVPDRIDVDTRMLELFVNKSSLALSDVVFNSSRIIAGMLSHANLILSRKITFALSRSCAITPARMSLLKMH